jgi:hypothetical protein
LCEERLDFAPQFGVPGTRLHQESVAGDGIAVEGQLVEPSDLLPAIGSHNCTVLLSGDRRCEPIPARPCSLHVGGTACNRHYTPPAWSAEYPSRSYNPASGLT